MLVASDFEAYERDLGQFTYVSHAHITTSWLDQMLQYVVKIFRVNWIQLKSLIKCPVLIIYKYLDINRLFHSQICNALQRSSSNCIASSKANLAIVMIT